MKIVPFAEFIPKVYGWASGVLEPLKNTQSVVHLCEGLGGIQRAIKCSKFKPWKWFGISDVYGEIRPERVH